MAGLKNHELTNVKKVYRGNVGEHHTKDSDEKYISENSFVCKKEK